MQYIKSDLPLLAMAAKIKVIGVDVDVDVQLGPFNFDIMVDDKVVEIPIDFEVASTGISQVEGEDNSVIVTYQSGKGLFFDDYNMTTVYAEDLAEKGLALTDITAELLSSITKINEFIVDFYRLDSYDNIDISLVSLSFIGDDMKSIDIDLDKVDTSEINWCGY